MSEQPKPTVPPPVFKVDGVRYEPRDIDKLRSELAEWRSEVLMENPYRATVLSHTIALLFYLMEWLDAHYLEGTTTQNDDTR